MSTYYLIYAEAKVGDKWYNLCPYFRKNKERKVEVPAEIYWAQSMFGNIYDNMRDEAISYGIPKDMSKEIKRVFYEPLDEEVPGYFGHITWKEYYEQSLMCVSFKTSVVNHVVKNRPFKYEGYVLKSELAAMECYEIEEFSEWLTEDEYKELTKKEQRQYIFHRWNDEFGTYGIYVDLYNKVNALKEMFQTAREGEIDGLLCEGISDDQIRLYIYRC